jgi:glucose/arabinose dehydrogenase
MKLKFYVLTAFFMLPQFVFSQYGLADAFPNLSFNYAVEMAHPPDGTDRLFVLEKGGIIKVFNNIPSVSNAKIFLDLSDSVSQYFYAGLFGIAFHPGYQSNRFFYVYYMKGALANLSLTVERYTTSATNPDSALRSSRQVLLTAGCPNSNHNGGSLHFGADGFLYMAFGDSSPGSGGDPLNKAQNLAELFGKVLRINVDSSSNGNNYSIPVTNPFYGNSLGYRQEIFAYGIRNPWKFSFDAPTGRLWLGDVGQSRWEEINIIENGKNYGWRLKEGNVCYNPAVNCDTGSVILTPPLYTYGHNSAGGYSITGGYVYRENQIPGLSGKYIYGDFESKRIWALSWDGVNPPTNEILFDNTPYSIVSFGTDRDNNLYLIHFSSSSRRIYKIYDQSINGIEGTGNGEYGNFTLSNSYPNPFNSSTVISYVLKNKSYVTLKIYDILGREIETIINGIQTAGLYKYTYDASKLASGVYLYNLLANGFTESRKFILFK